MKNKKKLILKIISLCIVLALIVTVVIVITTREKAPTQPVQDASLIAAIEQIEPMETKAAPKNVILMIGDGMGANHLEAAKTYFNLDKLQMEELATLDGKIATFSRDSQITDSAAAATAMSCGIKVNNDSVAKLDGKNLQTMCEYAQTLGKKTGVITTTTIYDATPACFSGHADNRYMNEDIINSQMKSGINLMISGKKSRRLITKELTEKNGYVYTESFAELSHLTETLQDKLFAVYPTISWTKDKSSDEHPTLDDVSLKAIQYLERTADDDGFFLMIEGADIDTYSHLNKFRLMVEELNGFDNAVAAVVEWATERDDTMVIVTADHECGALFYENDKLNNKAFASKNHTGDDVRVFFYGVTPFTEETWSAAGNRTDNTNISALIRQAMKNYATQEQEGK